MIFDHIAIGGGVVGLIVTEKIINKILNDQKILKNKKPLNYNFAIVDKEIDNIPGGVAYGLKKSKHGYFNNPIRLSPPEFVNFVKKNNNIKKILIKNLNKNGGITDKLWVKKYSKNIFKINSNEFRELYLPRFTLAYWLHSKLSKLLHRIENISKKNKINIKLFFFKALVTNIIKVNSNCRQIISENNYFSYFSYTFDLEDKFHKVNLNAKSVCINKIYSLNTTISLGIPPPQKFTNLTTLSKKNYIWDFYSEGSTQNLINIINTNKRNSINIFFIGFKAGLLEALPELDQLMKYSSKVIKLFCISPTLESVQKAKLSNKKYQLSYFNLKNLRNFNSAAKIFDGIITEFSNGLKKKFSKYDVWTQILQKKLIETAFKKLNFEQKKIYNSIYFSKIRELTRYTYPYPIEIKNKMIKEKKLIVINSKVKKIELNRNVFSIFAQDREYRADIVVNVSGPLSISKQTNEIKLYRNLKKQGLIFDHIGINTDNSFQILNHAKVYCPSLMASGFNPDRKTIVNAIINNSSIAADKIYKNIINFRKKKNSKYFFEKYYMNIIKNNSKKNIIKGGVAAPKCYFENNNIIINDPEKLKLISQEHKLSNNNIKVIIDGKAGAGKSTIGKHLSSLLNIIMIDTGYILKFTSKKIFIEKGNQKEVNLNKIKKIFNSIQLSDLTDKDLDNIKYRDITQSLATNVKIRKLFNKTIKRFSSYFNSFILTGRDTGKAVFNKHKEINKFFLNVKDLEAAWRKEKNPSFDFNTSDIIQRNQSDKININYSRNSIIIDNNHRNEYKTLLLIISFLS